MELSEMTLHDTTICAISTPPGCGGIAVVRISGANAISIADSVWKGKSLQKAASHTAHLGNIVDPADNSELDTAVATIYRAPNSFTGEDTVEFSVHGSTYIQAELLRLLTRQGCELASPGEFTRRAFANGRLDLTQAEAVADIIAATTRSAHRIASQQMHGRFSKRLNQLRQQLIDLSALLELELDFSDQEVEFAPRDRLINLAREIHGEVSRLADSFAIGNVIATGIPVAIVGNTNAGKSTLLNTLLQRDRAIVSAIKGTTRDTIEETTTIDGTLFRLIDTAGIRQTDDPIERLGIQRTIETIQKANIILWIIDPADTDNLDETNSAIRQNIRPDATLIILINKADLTDSNTNFTHPAVTADARLINISAKITAADTRLINISAKVTAADTQLINISAKEGTGIKQLTDALRQAAHIDDISADITVTNVRHYNALTLAAESTDRVIHGLKTNIPADLIAQDLRQTLHHLASITGQITTPDILSTIFSRFCVGK